MMGRGAHAVKIPEPSLYPSTDPSSGAGSGSARVDTHGHQNSKKPFQIRSLVDVSRLL